MARAERRESSASGNPGRPRTVPDDIMRPSLTTSLTSVLLGLLAASCISTSSVGRPVMSRAFQLAERTSDDGVRTKYRVQPERGGGPALLRIETRSLDVPYIGVSVRALNRDYAENLGLKPWRGVRITSIHGECAAREAGLRVGDVLVSLAGEELASVEEFKEVVAVLLQPGASTTGVRLRNDGSGAFVEESFEITPGTRTIEDSTTERIALDAPGEIVDRTGMQVATVDAELARESGMGEASLALVTGVVAGTSAYDAGVRGGDRIVGCNGAPVSGAGDVLKALRGGDSKLKLVVEGELGEHSARVGTDEDIDARRRFHVPIVIDYSSRVDCTHTSFLDFIFQFGFNYRRTVRESKTREPAVETYFSLFPLGMFEFERSPKRDRNTLFWFITWSTHR